jgi:hypothetical protein
MTLDDDNVHLWFKGVDIGCRHRGRVEAVEILDVVPAASSVKVTVDADPATAVTVLAHRTRPAGTYRAEQQQPGRRQHPAPLPPTHRPPPASAADPLPSPNES